MLSFNQLRLLPQAPSPFFHFNHSICSSLYVVSANYLIMDFCYFPNFFFHSSRKLSFKSYLINTAKFSVYSYLTTKINLSWASGQVSLVMPVQLCCLEVSLTCYIAIHQCYEQVSVLPMIFQNSQHSRNQWKQQPSPNYLIVRFFFILV